MLRIWRQGFRDLSIDVFECSELRLFHLSVEIFFKYRYGIEYKSPEPVTVKYQKMRKFKKTFKNPFTTIFT